MTTKTAEEYEAEISRLTSELRAAKAWRDTFRREMEAAQESGKSLLISMKSILDERERLLRRVFNLEQIEIIRDKRV